MTSTTTPSVKLTNWGVNALGVRTSRTDALTRITNYTLDNWNRVTTVDYTTGTDPTYTYDANSNLTGSTDATGKQACTKAILSPVRVLDGFPTGRMDP